MKIKLRQILVPAYILGLFVLGYYTADKLNIVLTVDKTIVPTFFQIFTANLASSLLLMLVNLLFGLGIFGVTYLAFNLGIQLYSVIVAYETNNLLSAISILSIHGIFEIAAMVIIINTAITVLSIWKNYLFGELNSLSYSYKIFLKTTFVKNIIFIFIFILVGSLLETNVSTHLFKCLN